MPVEYESRFTIGGNNSAVGVNLLREVTERITSELISSTADTTDEGAPDVETGTTETAGYTRISAERNYPSAPKYRMRLEVRLCTKGERLEAEVRSRFLSADGAEPPNLPAGPPRMLQAIAEGFSCVIGSDLLTYEPTRITTANVQSFASESILSPLRQLPVLAISEDNSGKPALDPARAQRSLAGVAAVAVCDKDAANAMSQYVGRSLACYDGAIRVFWPGCSFNANGGGPRLFYMRGPAHAKGAGLLRELQQACIDNAPESDFDSIFSDARVSVILERNRLLETQQNDASEQSSEAPTSDVGALQRDLRRQEIAAREANRKWKNALATVAKMEQELAEAKANIEELSALQPDVTESQGERESTRILRAENRELRERLDRLTETNSKLNEDNQLLRQQERQNRNDASAYVIRLDCPHPGNVTILNYAVNLYRDPMRRYIINNLDASDEDGLREILRMSIEIHPSAKEKPEALIDVNDFHNIVTDNPTYFDNSRNLAWSLRQIRDVRNRAAHPPPDGIRDDFTQYGLTCIAEALETIDARQELMEVVRLRDRIHSN